MKRASTLMRYVSSELKKMRETRGWSQRELAEKLKMSRQRVTMIESGKEEVRLGTLVEVAQALGATVTVEIRWKH